METVTDAERAAFIEGTESGRLNLALEINGVLKAMGHWVPRDARQTDIIFAIGRALDKAGPSPAVVNRTVLALQAGVLALSHATATNRDPLDQAVIDEMKAVINLLEETRQSTATSLCSSKDRKEV